MGLKEDYAALVEITKKYLDTYSQRDNINDAAILALLISMDKKLKQLVEKK